MRKSISVLAWIFVIITSLCLILTMISTCGILQIKYFTNYRIFQENIVITMILWSINQIPFKNGKWTNSILCMFVGVGAMLFMFMKIY